MSNYPRLQKLLDDVIEAGLCTGCGACEGVCPQGIIRLKINDIERDDPFPVMKGMEKCINCGKCIEVCPGREIHLDELEKGIFGYARNPEVDHLGLYKDCYRGYARNDQIREGSSSGGIVTALSSYLLDKGIVDSVLFAERDPKTPWRCSAAVASNSKEVKRGVRSAMEIIPVMTSLKKIEKGKKVAVIGLPCHIHAFRKIESKKILPIKPTFSIGLFCNSCKYFMGVEHLIKEYIQLESLKDIVWMDWRGGEWPGALYIQLNDGKIHRVATKGQYSTFFGSGNYKRDRCLLCLDFAAETADIAVGDIFQTGSINNPRWSAVLARTELGFDIINRAMKEDYVMLERYDADKITASGYGWEASKHANQFRLKERERFGLPVPDYGYEFKTKPRYRKISFTD